MDQAGLSPADVDVLSVYDDYPVMVLVQLADLGFAPDDDLEALVSRIAEHDLPVNTGGDNSLRGKPEQAAACSDSLKSSASSAAAAAAGRWRVRRFGLVTGYGMVTYRFGSSANATVLERP